MIEILADSIDRRKVTESVASETAGAVVTFDGQVRDHSRGKAVSYLHYEAYSGMAIREMEQIVRKAEKKWPVEKIALVHRTGRVEIGESSVFIAVSSAHRSEAFDCCRFIIDSLKKTVPIWKKEVFVDGEVWQTNEGA